MCERGWSCIGYRIQHGKKGASGRRDRCCPRSRGARQPVPIHDTNPQQPGELFANPPSLASQPLEPNTSSEIRIKSGIVLTERWSSYDAGYHRQKAFGVRYQRTTWSKPPAPTRYPNEWEHIPQFPLPRIKCEAVPGWCSLGTTTTSPSPVVLQQSPENRQKVSD